jgi:DUF4097 and DUF4098 domain-containing protein YvlB
MLRSLLVTIALLAVAATGQPFDFQDEVTLSYSPDSVTEINLSTGAGNIEVRAGGGDAITLRVLRQCRTEDEDADETLLEEIVVEPELSGDQLTLNLELPDDVDGGNASLVLTCPAGTELRLETGAGNVSVTGITSGVEASTEAGYVRLSGTGGAAEVETGAGEINVSSHTGGITASTGAGGITCVISEVGERDAVSLETGAGAVTLRLPDDISATVDAATEKGSVSLTGFDVIWDLETEEAIIGTILFGETEVTVRTGAGNISIGAN